RWAPRDAPSRACVCAGVCVTRPPFPFPADRASAAKGTGPPAGRQHRRTESHQGPQGPDRGPEEQIEGDVRAGRSRGPRDAAAERRAEQAERRKPAPGEARRRPGARGAGGAGQDGGGAGGAGGDAQAREGGSGAQGRAGGEEPPHGKRAAEEPAARPGARKRRGDRVAQHLPVQPRAQEAGEGRGVQGLREEGERPGRGGENTEPGQNTRPVETGGAGPVRDVFGGDRDGFEQRGARPRGRCRPGGLQRDNHLRGGRRVDGERPDGGVLGKDAVHGQSSEKRESGRGGSFWCGTRGPRRRRGGGGGARGGGGRETAHRARVLRRTGAGEVLLREGGGVRGQPRRGVRGSGERLHVPPSAPGAPRAEIAKAAEGSRPATGAAGRESEAVVIKVTLPKPRSNAPSLASLQQRASLRAGGGTPVTAYRLYHRCWHPPLPTRTAPGGAEAGGAQDEDGDARGGWFLLEELAAAAGAGAGKPPTYFYVDPAPGVPHAFRCTAVNQAGESEMGPESVPVKIGQ
ncbi:MAG: hypothetical protein BJ554DRAFT_4029, partial [Olpidium bornovanus]